MTFHEKTMIKYESANTNRKSNLVLCSCTEIKQSVLRSVAKCRNSNKLSCTDEAGTWIVDAEGRSVDIGSAKVTEARLRSPDCWITGSSTDVVCGTLLAGTLLLEVLPLLPIGFWGISSSSFGSSITFCGAAKTRPQGFSRLINQLTK